MCQNAYLAKYSNGRLPKCIFNTKAYLSESSLLPINNSIIDLEFKFKTAQKSKKNETRRDSSLTLMICPYTVIKTVFMCYFVYSSLGREDGCRMQM